MESKRHLDIKTKAHKNLNQQNWGHHSWSNLEAEVQELVISLFGEIKLPKCKNQPKMSISHNQAPIISFFLHFRQNLRRGREVVAVRRKGEKEKKKRHF
jgi:hypothetical protein